jgi:hypothetical protein
MPKEREVEKRRDVCGCSRYNIKYKKEAKNSKEMPSIPRLLAALYLEKTRMDQTSPRF